MSLRDSVEKKAIEVGASQVERRLPAVKRALAWLNASPGRKRGLAAIVGAVALGLEAAGRVLKGLCNAEVLDPLGSACSADPASWAVPIQELWAAVEPVLTGSATLVTIGLAVWGWAHAQREKRA